MSHSCWRNAMLTALSLGLAATAVGAQTSGPAPLPQQHDCTKDAPSRISGHMIVDSTGLPVTRARFVSIRGGPVWCAILSDDHGDFTFRNLPPGDYEVSSGDPANHYRSVLVHVPLADTASRITFRLRAENAAEDCADIEACREVISGNRDALATLTKDQLQTEAVFRTAIALAGLPWREKRNWIACVPTEDTVVLAALQREIRDVRPANECAMALPQGGGTRALMYHTKTGTWAFKLGLESWSGGVTQFEADVSYTAGVRWGQAWHCKFLLTDNVWRPTECRSTWIS